MPAIHPDTRIGHAHLKVADLDRAVAFYRDVLGFEVTRYYGTSAAFLSAGGYHHHIGLNVWDSRGGTPPPPGHTGLFHVAILTVSPGARSCSAPAGRRPRAAHGRLGPRRQRGVVPQRPRRQRPRALRRPPAGGMAPGRRRSVGDGDPRARSRRPVRARRRLNGHSAHDDRIAPLPGDHDGAGSERRKGGECPAASSGIGGA